MCAVSSKPIDSYIGLYTSFFDELINEYGFTFSMTEAMNGIKYISDPLDVEDVLYTMQGSLCHTKEECDIFEVTFCKRFLHYVNIPAEKKAPSKKPSRSVAAFLNMTDKALDDFLRKTRMNREQALQDIESCQNAKPSDDAVCDQEQAVAKAKSNRQAKLLDKQSAETKCQQAKAEAVVSENSDLFRNFEDLLQKCNALADDDMLSYGISEERLRSLVSSATQQTVTQAQKSVMSAAILARNAKKPDLYKAFLSMAQVIQSLGKSVKQTQAGIESSDQVQKAKEAVAQAEQALEDASAAYFKENGKLSQMRDLLNRYNRELRDYQKKVSTYDDILSDAQKALKEKNLRLISKTSSKNHRELFLGGHNAVKSQQETDFILNQDIKHLSNESIKEILTYIRTNAKVFRQKLRKQYMTQQKRQIDVKRTIEKSVQCDGEIAKLYYKKPIKSKANIVMLADISGSCRTMTALALTYMGLMREVFPGGCHLFVFVNHLVSVDHYFSNENVTAAVESINKNVPSRGIYSDYGVPLRELRCDNTGIINKDTTIVMLGDCRNNKNYTGEEEVEWLSKRAANFFVLNPEPRDEWGQGDSIADLYARSGAVVSQVGSAKDLLTFLQTAGTTRRL